MNLQFLRLELFNVYFQFYHFAKKAGKSQNQKYYFLLYLFSVFNLFLFNLVVNFVLTDFIFKFKIFEFDKKIITLKIARKLCIVLFLFRSFNYICSFLFVINEVCRARGANFTIFCTNVCYCFSTKNASGAKFKFVAIITFRFDYFYTDFF